MDANRSVFYSASLKNNFYKETVLGLLAKAEVCINGLQPWDIQVHDEKFYPWIFRQGSLAFGESYMAGMWDCPALDQLMYRLFSANLDQYIPHSFKSLWYKIKTILWNGQSVKRAQQDIRKHYDLGNDLFEAILDKRMMYSCAYWQNAATLEEAQDHKLDLICRKLQLEKGQKILDIGCGWGGFAAFAAERYGVEVVGITLSAEQVKLARERCKHLPVEIRLQDYRSLDEKFDGIVSIGMFEHVGYKNYDYYMNVIQRTLKEDGLFLLHCIGSNSSVTAIDPWINSHIFPNAVIPSVTQIGQAAEHKLVMEDWHNFRVFYDLTLMEWLKRFRNAWPNLETKYDKQFYRMWEYYLSCSAASFRSNKNNLWQIVFSKPKRHTAYQSVR
ncbi:cyclopropane fatty acyl phospholipid synthase [Mucilaginibacter sp.]|uniref:cyclopropane fatty acyl phospholipid synthase n=1 Tax=Mucilaginibacter sp. TaxID=1882438 RepID=UPI0026197A98|nr:cyclopropane fatty acyl phospholipid synthase [Mucilaginibacter sp.]MDB4918816.1 cyclopropane-fatty-acyl-phospholipid synthase [Mucilaginibacter sp.]